MQIEKVNRQKVKAALIEIPRALVEINAYLVACIDAWKRRSRRNPETAASALIIVMDAAAMSTMNPSRA